MLSHPVVKSLRGRAVIALSLLATSGVVLSAEPLDCPGADAEALQWLDKMSRSLRQVSYQGVVTLQRDENMQVMQVSHSVGPTLGSERLTELTGQGAHVERGDHPLDCVHPGYQMLRLESPPKTDRCGIAAHYRFSIAEGERVAGRNAVRIRIEPRDMYRFGYVLALDNETGLLLKSQIVNQGHETLETMQFAQLSYTDSVPTIGQVAVIHQAEHPRTDSTGTRLAVGRAWTVGWLPRGFAATDSPLGIGGRRTYTDGLAVFSVFLEALDREISPGEGMVRQGGTTTYTRGMRLAGRPVLVTVIGEVPVNTARMVADSVSWTQ
jgi:sigma-E factor negative regulatory protein RseB